MSDIAQENSPLLNAIGLKKYYPVKKGMFTKTQQVKALDGVSFSLERGKTLAVVGESGCGKSTLGRLLTMIEEPTEQKGKRRVIYFPALPCEYREQGTTAEFTGIL